MVNTVKSLHLNVFLNVTLPQRSCYNVKTVLLEYNCQSVGKPRPHRLLYLQIIALAKNQNYLDLLLLIVNNYITKNVAQLLRYII